MENPPQRIVKLVVYIGPLVETLVEAGTALTSAASPSPGTDSYIFPDIGWLTNLW